MIHKSSTDILNKRQKSKKKLTKKSEISSSYYFTNKTKTDINSKSNPKTNPNSSSILYRSSYFDTSKEKNSGGINSTSKMTDYAILFNSDDKENSSRTSNFQRKKKIKEFQSKEKTEVSFEEKSLEGVGKDGKEIPSFKQIKERVKKHRESEEEK